MKSANEHAIRIWTTLPITQCRQAIEQLQSARSSTALPGRTTAKQCGTVWRRAIGCATLTSYGRGWIRGFSSRFRRTEWTIHQINCTIRITNQQPQRDRAMNINELTIGQAKELAAMFGATAKASGLHPFVGKYCIIRTYSAGVHAGVLVSQDGDLVTLKDSRRLWSWTAKSGVALSGVAINGYKDGKIDTAVPDIFLTGAIETIPCSEAAESSIRNA